MVDAPSVAPASDAAARPGRAQHDFRFEGSGAEYFLIFLKHVFLTSITLGVYFAWAKTERRAFIWRCLSFDDHPFRYTGTGIELFRGYVLVLFVYAAFVMVPILVGLVSEAAASFVEIGLALAIVPVIPFAIYRSRNFLYSRTTLRGVRFGLIADSSPYVRQFLLGIVLGMLTLGLYVPINQNRLHGILVNHTRFGDLAFHYDGDDWTAWRITMKGVLFGILTLGLYYPWYRAELERFRAGHTRIGEGAVLASDVRGVDLLRLYLLNIVGLTLTLGLAFPWILMYSMGDLARRFVVRGTIDFDGISQRAEESGAFAEGIADALDLDFGL